LFVSLPIVRRENFIFPFLWTVGYRLNINPLAAHFLEVITYFLQGAFLASGPFPGADALAMPVQVLVKIK
jgi:hypothetical protein